MVRLFSGYAWSILKSPKQQTCDALNVLTLRFAVHIPQEKAIAWIDRSAGRTIHISTKLEFAVLMSRVFWSGGIVRSGKPPTTPIGKRKRVTISCSLLSLPKVSVEIAYQR